MLCWNAWLMLIDQTYKFVILQRKLNIGLKHIALYCFVLATSMYILYYCVLFVVLTFLLTRK